MPGPQTVTLFGHSFDRDSPGKVRSGRWAPIPCDWCPYWKGSLEMDVLTRSVCASAWTAVFKPRRGLGRSHPCRCFHLRLPGPGLGDEKFLLSQPPGLGALLQQHPRASAGRKEEHPVGGIIHSVKCIEDRTQTCLPGLSRLPVPEILVSPCRPALSLS